MKKEEFYFDSRDNETRIHAVRYVPEGREPLCVVQIIHGMAEYVERYEEFARFLTDQGCVVTGNDHLGHGKSVGEENATAISASRIRLRCWYGMSTVSKK